jgi:hypothetical protein
MGGGLANTDEGVDGVGLVSGAGIGGGEEKFEAEAGVVTKSPKSPNESKDVSPASIDIEESDRAPNI